MGETLHKVASQIVGDSHFSLWLSEQLYVIASRVRNLQDITFVGTKENNEVAVKDLLFKNSHWAALTNEILRSVHLQNVSIHQSRVHPYPSNALSPPTSNTGFCYLLQSAPQPQHLYIGLTMSLKQRLRQRNSGNGSTFTDVIARRPWVLVAFVTGFAASNARSDIRKFEKDWIRCLINLRQVSRRNVSMEDAITEAKTLIERWRADDHMLPLVITY